MLFFFPPRNRRKTFKKYYSLQSFAVSQPRILLLLQTLEIPPHGSTSCHVNGGNISRQTTSTITLIIKLTFLPRRRKNRFIGVFVSSNKRVAQTIKRLIWRQNIQVQFKTAMLDVFVDPQERINHLSDVQIQKATLSFSLDKKARP